MGQGGGSSPSAGSTWTSGRGRVPRAATPVARRRRNARGADGSASDVDDLIPTMVALQIEWKKLRVALRGSGEGIQPTDPEGLARPSAAVRTTGCSCMSLGGHVRRTAGRDDRAAATALRVRMLGAPRSATRGSPGAGGSRSAARWSPSCCSTARSTSCRQLTRDRQPADRGRPRHEDELLRPSSGTGPTTYGWSSQRFRDRTHSGSLEQLPVLRGAGSVRARPGRPHRRRAAKPAWPRPAPARARRRRAGDPARSPRPRASTRASARRRRARCARARR